ncbi:acetate--CoA ligase family protein [Pseudogracilibacillus sp. SO30301A]|uniref:acetate--CoA ligase family protein n=1 Tax=Pseudogracilibacillus sp. SO30301A TaxID=3098291 RepID=UPI00300E0752
MNLKHANLRQFLSPRNIAYIGNKHFVQQGIRNCRKLGYKGEIFAICRSEEKIDGIPCYKTIQEVPGKIDAAFLAIRNDRTIEAIKELANLGTAGCVCYAAGFSEIGKEQLQTELIQAAGNMAVVGPNCYGVLNYLDRISLWPDRHGVSNVEKGVAIISQSGNISLNLTMNERSLPLAYVIDVGNQAVLEMADYISTLCEDPRVTVIGLHIEGVKDINAFSKAAKKALEKGIPLVALKTGTSEMGSKLTMSHTSSLAGSDELYLALFDRLNICRVHSLHALLETLKLFAVVAPVTGRKLGVLTCSGGESTLVADLAATYNFTLPNLQEEQVEVLEKHFTEFEHVSNPLDYNTSIWGKKQELEECFSAILKGDFDVSLLILDLLDQDNGDVKAWIAAVNALIEAKKQTNTNTLVVSTLPEGLPTSIRNKLIEHGIAPMQGLNEAFQALYLVHRYFAKRKNIEEIPTRFLVCTSSDASSAYALNEWEGKQALQAYGVPVPKGMVVTKEEELVLSGMNAPFVVKGVSKELAHKTEFEAVKLHLQNKTEIIDAMEQINQNLTHLPVNDKQFLIEEMISNPVAELNIGIKRDDQFGLALVISMGGELVHLLNDSVAILLPTTSKEIMEGLLTLKGVKLLQGFRGKAEGDIEAVIATAKAIASYAEDHRDSLLELDVNPLLVLTKGKGVIAVDAFIRKQLIQDLKIVL